MNKELIGNISNLVNRTLSFIHRFYDGKLETTSVDSQLLEQIKETETQIDTYFERAELRDALREILKLSSIGNKAFQDAEPWKLMKEDNDKTKTLLLTLTILIRDIGYLLHPFMPSTSQKILKFLEAEHTTYEMLGSLDGIGRLQKIEHLFVKLDDDRIEELKIKYSGTQASRNEERTVQEKEEQVSIEQQFANKVALKVAKIEEVEQHPGGERLYIIQLNTGSPEPTQIVSSIVPYYTKEELLGQNIILVENLKPANFRGVKSRGMLLAASDPTKEEHSTCEVIFAPQFEVGTQLHPFGTELPETRTQLKADVFFSYNMYSEEGIVKVNETTIGSGETPLTVSTYLNGEIG